MNYFCHVNFKRGILTFISQNKEGETVGTLRPIWMKWNITAPATKTTISDNTTNNNYKTNENILRAFCKWTHFLVSFVVNEQKIMMVPWILLLLFLLLFRVICISTNSLDSRKKILRKSIMNNMREVERGGVDIELNAKPQKGDELSA